MRLNPELFAKVLRKRGGSRSRLYAVLQQIQFEHHVSPHVALLKLATDHKIGIARFAEANDRAELRSMAAAKTQYSAPPSSSSVAARTVARIKTKPAKPTRDNSIFVVHGRDLTLRDDMYSFLRALGLNPIEWNHAIAAAKGGANPIVGTVINNAMKKAQGIMVLLSPDEESKLKPKFVTQRDKRQHLHTLEGQPRPNVIFEAGLALGAHSDKTILVQVGEVREISDIAGKHMVHLTNDASARQTLAERLRIKLRFKIDPHGNWLKVGNFDR
jgi:predicted nucleotide-binding protein